MAAEWRRLFARKGKEKQELYNCSILHKHHVTRPPLPAVDVHIQWGDKGEAERCVVSCIPIIARDNCQLLAASLWNNNKNLHPPPFLTASQVKIHQSVRPLVRSSPAIFFSLWIIPSSALRTLMHCVHTEREERREVWSCSLSREPINVNATASDKQFRINQNPRVPKTQTVGCAQRRT